MSVIAFSSVIGPVPIGCVISEDHSSTIEITGNPIETGAEVNDHAYVKPKQVVLEIADSNAALTYNALVAFQESRVPFYLVTGLKLYRDMLVQAIDAYRDKDNYAVLKATVYLRQVIIVSTATSSSSQNSAGSGASGGGKKAQPGGANSRNSVTPSRQSATNTSTANRTSGTVTRGTSPSTQVQPARSQSLAKSIFG